MNKFVLLALVGSFALMSEGCSYLSDFTKARKDLERENVKPVPVQVNTAQNQAQPEEELFADLEEQEETAQTIVGLIPATNPDVRVRGSVRGRTDPFSVVTLNPQIEIKETEKQNNSNNNPQSNRFNQNSRNQAAGNPVASNSADLPAPPVEPSLAQDVVISGLFEADGRTRIIVKAPEESSSRYVEAGQYLSDGRILVKKIDKDAFPSPVVILEQAGREVAKTIGNDLAGDEDVSSLPTDTLPRQDWISSIPSPN